MPNKLLVRNPALNEFVWDLLYNITPEQKKKLSTPFLRILRSKIKCKNFAEFSTLDEKVRFFSELGLESAFVFFQDKIQSVNALKKILEKYEQEKELSASKDIVQLKAFVSSDKTVKWLLGVMADTIHHKSYFLNLDYNKVGYHLKKWDKNRNTKDSLELQQTLDSSDFIAKTFLNASISFKLLEGFLGVRENEMDILLLLHGYRHTYIEKERIWDYFAGSVTKGKVTSSLKRLFMSEYVKRHIDLKKQKYTITASGIDLVNQFIQRVLKSNNF